FGGNPGGFGNQGKSPFGRSW
uniref:Uncharacterized protein n=1 Tax=Ictidomys tridecemlineatus TaxID=43179 RepID=A0A287CSL0_ICTTR